MPDWTVLRCEDGDAITIPEGTTAVAALVEMLEQCYGGEWTADMPGVVDAAADVHVQRWFSCTKKWKENDGSYDGDPDDGLDYWSPDGDGKRSILVAWSEKSVYLIGEDLEPEPDETTARGSRP